LLYLGVKVLDDRVKAWRRDPAVYHVCISMQVFTLQHLFGVVIGFRLDLPPEVKPQYNAVACRYADLQTCGDMSMPCPESARQRRQRSNEDCPYACDKVVSASVTCQCVSRTAPVKGPSISIIPKKIKTGSIQEEKRNIRQQIQSVFHVSHRLAVSPSRPFRRQGSQ
jgi:hypothetical protein